LVERPEGLPLGVSGRIEVHCDEEGYRVLQTLDDGNVVQLARVELRWAPGSVPLTVLTLALLLAVAAAVVLALPLILRVRRLEFVTAAIADGDLGIRAPESEGDELGRLGRHINEMTSQVATHIGTQEALLHAIAHEYRTPLTSARFALSILGDCIDDADRDRQLARLGMAYRVSRRWRPFVSGEAFLRTLGFEGGASYRKTRLLLGTKLRLGRSEFALFTGIDWIEGNRPRRNHIVGIEFEQAIELARGSGGEQ